MPNKPEEERSGEGDANGGQPLALHAASGSALRYERDDLNVICPHCGASYQAEAEDFSEAVREEECFSCKKSYQVWQEFSVSHCTASQNAQISNGENAGQ